MQTKFNIHIIALMRILHNYLCLIAHVFMDVLFIIILCCGECNADPWDQHFLN